MGTLPRRRLKGSLQDANTLMRVVGAANLILSRVAKEWPRAGFQPVLWANLLASNQSIALNLEELRRKVRAEQSDG